MADKVTFVSNALPALVTSPDFQVGSLLATVASIPCSF
jgi:hypothetical protein